MESNACDVTRAFQPRDDDISFIDSSDEEIHKSDSSSVKLEQTTETKPEVNRSVIECLHKTLRVCDWLDRKSQSTSCLLVTSQQCESVASALRRVVSLEDVQTSDDVDILSSKMHSRPQLAQLSSIRKTSAIQLCDKTTNHKSTNLTTTQSQTPAADAKLVTSPSQSQRTCSHSSADSGRGDTASSFSESGISANSHVTSSSIDELPSPFATNERVTLRRCRCKQVRQQRRTVHLDDVITGPAKRKYRVKDIIDSVDDLIGAFCEDSIQSELDTSGSSRSSLTSQYTSFVRRASARLSDVNLLRRKRDVKPTRKTVSFNLNGDTCGRSTCCNCQEARTLATDDVIEEQDDSFEATLDCYSRALTKRLQVETYCRKCKTSQKRPQKQSTSSTGDDDVTTAKSKTSAFARDLLRRSRTWLQLPVRNAKLLRHVSDTQVSSDASRKVYSKDAESIESPRRRVESATPESHYFSDTGSSLKRPPLPHIKSPNKSAKKTPTKDVNTAEVTSSRADRRVIGRRAMRQKQAPRLVVNELHTNDVTSSKTKQILETEC